jgi:hypothetical protein
MGSQRSRSSQRSQSDPMWSLKSHERGGIGFDASTLTIPISFSDGKGSKWEKKFTVDGMLAFVARDLRDGLTEGMRE